MVSFATRTEDIAREAILRLYVETAKGKEAVELLKSPKPMFLEGSRGTGKTFLLRVAEAKLVEEFAHRRILPVYVSFLKSSLLQSGDPNQFTNWMMARLCSRIVRTLSQLGLLTEPMRLLSLLTGEEAPINPSETRLERVAAEYEESYRNPGKAVDSAVIPTVSSFKVAVEEICRSRGIERVVLLFDKAAHAFRPDQQRQFFTLFRDLRSPYLCCKAAVYPEMATGGRTFEAAKGASVVSLVPDLHDSGYLGAMREMVSRQADPALAANLGSSGKNFDALAYAANGNPRFLLKTVLLGQHLDSGEVAKALRGFYGNEIWSEHFGLADTYPVHRALMDWGRGFIKESVIPDLLARNGQWAREGKAESSYCFAIHDDAPAGVFEALRLLGCKGIVTQLDSCTASADASNTVRYALSLGCLAAGCPNPIATLTSLGQRLDPLSFVEYTTKHMSFAPLVSIGHIEEVDLSAELASELAKSIDVLDLTDHQKQGLRSVGLDTVCKALQGSDLQLQKSYYIGPKKSRQMLNNVVASVHHYLSG